MFDRLREIAKPLIELIPEIKPDIGEQRFYQLPKEIRRGLVHGDKEEYGEALRWVNNQEEQGRIVLGVRGLDFANDVRGHAEMFERLNEKQSR